MCGLQIYTKSKLHIFSFGNMPDIYSLTMESVIFYIGQ